jgi:type IV pilus assembly protein PilA
VAIIGILAAVALPAYQDYTVRAKVSEIILALSSGKTAVAESAQVNGGMPSTGSSPVTTQASKYVASLAYTQTSGSVGVITAVATTIEPKISGKTVQMTGTMNASGNGQVDWVCATGATTPMDAKYLPASCK